MTLRFLIFKCKGVTSRNHVTKIAKQWNVENFQAQHKGRANACLRIMNEIAAKSVKAKKSFPEKYLSETWNIPEII